MEHPFLMFLDHTQRRSTVGRTPLDEWSARRRDLYLTTHDTHNKQISMPPVGFEPKISAGERPQAAGHRPQVTGRRPQATGHRPQACTEPQWLYKGDLYLTLPIFITGSNCFLVQVRPLAKYKFSDLIIKIDHAHFISRCSRKRTRNTIYRCVRDIGYGHL